MLCAAPGRIGMIEGERKEASAAGAAWSEEEVGDGARPYVPNSPQVTMQSNLSTADEMQEWLLNCLPKNALEGIRRRQVGLTGKCSA